MTTLALINPLDVSGGSRVPVRVCSSSHPDATGASGETWWPAITEQPVITARFFDGDFTSGVEPGSAAIRIRLDVLIESGAFAQVKGYDWAGAPVTIYRLVDGAPEVLAVMRVESFAMEDYDLALRLKVDDEPFQADVLTSEYAGTTGAEGGSDLKGVVKPWVFGRAVNVEPVFIDQIDNVFQVSAYGPVQAITAVFERGSSFGESIGNFADYAALVAANIPEGRWGTCLAQGMFRLGAPPAGVITCDVDGDNTGGFLRRTGAIIKEIASRLSLTAKIDTASFDALDAAVARNVNIVISQQTSLLDLARRMVNPCNAVAGVNFEGKLIAPRVPFGASSLTLDAQGRQLPAVLGMGRQNTSPPYKRIQMGAARTWRVHSLDEIAFYATLTDRGLYNAATVYREGDIVTTEDGARWLYVALVPGSGNAPPNWPTTTNDFWANLSPPVAGAGGTGINTATIAIYQRAASAPAAPSGTTTFTFATGALTGLDNGWQLGFPDDNGQPAWRRQVFVSSSAATADVASGDWSASVQEVVSGSDGADGLNVATVTIYKRSASAPGDTPANGAVYTFATGALSGTLNGWSTSAPATDGNPLWSRQAVASSATATDTIAAAEWSAAQQLVVDGADGTSGINQATVWLYRRSATEPAVPSVTSTYTFATGVLTGQNNSWTQTIPAGSDPLYVITAVALSSGATDTILTGEWASPVVLVQDGQAASSGLNNARVLIYLRSATSPTLPSVTTTYTFATGGLTGLNNGWTTTIPTSNGQPLWVSAATAAATTPSDTIEAAEWVTPTILVEDGADGSPGDPGADGSDGLSAFLTNDSFNVFAFANGVVSNYSGATGSFRVLLGSTDISSFFTLSTAANPQGLAVTYTNQTYTVTGGLDAGEDTANLTIRATGSGAYTGIILDRVFSLGKNKGGYAIVASLPGIGDPLRFEGSVVFLTTDDKLYRFNGSAWVASVPATDITGQLTDAQIEAIAAAKLTGTITTTQIADDAISTPKLAAGAVTAAEIAAGAVVAEKIAADAVTAAKIEAGAVLASKIAANAVTADKIEAGAVTAAKIGVTELTAITANIGEATAGILRSQSGGARFDLNSARIIFDNGTHIKVIGLGFGTSNQFLEWFGPRPTDGDVALCTEANALTYLKTNGDAYFGGTLSAGILKNAAQTSSTLDNASITIGPFGTNGDPIQIVTTYSLESSFLQNYLAGEEADWEAAVTAWGGDPSLGFIDQTKSITCSVTVRVDRVVDGVTTVGWATLTILSGTERITGASPIGTSGSLNYVRTVSASITSTDSVGGLEDRTFTATITNRSATAINGTIQFQRVGLISTEEEPPPPPP